MVQVYIRVERMKDTILITWTFIQNYITQFYISKWIPKANKYFIKNTSLEKKWNQVHTDTDDNENQTNFPKIRYLS